MNTVFSIQWINEVAHFHVTIHLECTLSVIFIFLSLTIWSVPIQKEHYSRNTNWLRRHTERTFLMTIINVGRNTALSVSDLRIAAAHGTQWAIMMLISLLLALWKKKPSVKMSHQPRARILTRSLKNKPSQLWVFSSPDSPSWWGCSEAGRPSDPSGCRSRTWCGCYRRWPWFLPGRHLGVKDMNNELGKRQKSTMLLESNVNHNSVCLLQNENLVGSN